MSIFYGGRVVFMLVVAALSMAERSPSQMRRRNTMPGTGEIVSMANFALTVVAGQPTAFSQRLLQFRPAPGAAAPPPSDVWYHVTRALPASHGFLSLVDRPQQKVSRFSQADVDAQRVLLVPPETAPAPAQPLALQLRATLGPSGAELAPAQTLRIRVREPAAAPPAFRQRNPVLRLDQVTKLDIGKQYFEIEGVDDDDPNLIFVVTEAPASGTLLFVHDRKSAVNLHGGQEFYLNDFYNGSVQYRYHGDKNKIKDSFEVLATDGNFEISNLFTLEVLSKQNKNDVRRDKTSANPLVSSVQFASESETVLVFENITLVRVPVFRTGDISQEGFVRCFTSTENNEYPSATPGKDFEPRARGADSSLLIFNSGMKTVYCEVIIIDDDVYENEEEFSLRLELVPGNIISSLQNRTQLKIMITDPDDKPTVQFDREHVRVFDNSNRFNLGISTPITINVLRTGDSSSQSRVHISTQDGSAVKGLDYEQLSTSLLFGPGDKLRTINISVLQAQRNSRQRRHDRYFYVIINPQDVLGAVVGEASTVTVFITPANEGQKWKLFPSEPVILSLQNGSVSNFTNVVSPGYPLICISSCDKHHPLFNITSYLCHLTGIEDSNNTYFSWEIAPPYKGTVSRVTTHLPFQELFEPTVFADVHSKILDPSFFGENYKIRCATTPLEGNGLPPLGIPIKSNEVLIGGKNISRCPLQSKDLLNSERTDESSIFTTKMKYASTTETNPDLKNKIHIQVEIPHNDGMVPLISTSPLSNIHSPLASRHHGSEHVCSNLPPSGVFLNTLSENIVNNPVWTSPEENVTNLLYRHLNYTSCKWIFEGWFYLSQLIENCHGKISSQHQDTRQDQSWVSVQVPLYIALHHAHGPAEIHHTRLLVSFHYSPSLGHSLQQEYKQSDADIQVTRVRADERGRLVLEFVTEARFPGHFVLQHAALPEARAQLLPPASVPTPFALRAAPRALRSPDHQPARQAWTALSTFSLQDYSGEYTVVLVPCWRSSAQSPAPAAVAVAAAAACVPRAPVRLPLRVRFRRGAPPAPLRFALETRFLLARAPPLAPADLQDYSGPFEQDDALFGRVLWLPEQRRHAAYELRIQRVLLCATPRGSAPPARCVPPADPRPSHLLLLLDREHLGIIDQSFNQVNFNASFASDSASMTLLDSYSSVDGFTFEVAPLYSPGTEQLQWHLQVLYIIKPSQQRTRRGTIQHLSTQNATSVRTLQLKIPEKSENVTEQILGIAFGPALILLLIFFLVTGGFLYTQHICSEIPSRPESSQV